MSLLICGAVGAVLVTGITMVLFGTIGWYKVRWFAVGLVLAFTACLVRVKLVPEAVGVEDVANNCVGLVSFLSVGYLCIRHGWRRRPHARTQ